MNKYVYNIYKLDDVNSYKLLKLRFFNLNNKIKYKSERLNLNVKISDLSKDQQRLCNLKKKEEIILNQWNN